MDRPEVAESRPRTILERLERIEQFIGKEQDQNQNLWMSLVTRVDAVERRLAALEEKVGL